jgi:hypothetical protein
MGWWECSVTVGETERSGFLNVSATGGRCNFAPRMAYFFPGLATLSRLSW